MTASQPGQPGARHHQQPERVAAIAQLGWVVVVHQDRSEGLAPLLAQTRAMLLLVLVMAAVVISVAIGGAQLLSGPITRLTPIARLVTAGDLSVQARAEAQDEIGALAHASIPWWASCAT